MNFESIDQIFAENDRVHEDLERLLASISESAAGTLADGEKWTIQQVVEHIATVDEGASKISSRLLSKARDEGMATGGSIELGEGFRTNMSEIDHMKLEAPERVQPAGNIPIAESLDRMKKNRRRLRETQPLLEMYGGNTEKFPHPFLGDLSAIEWLVMKSGHEARHTRQIRTILEKLG